MKKLELHKSCSTLSIFSFHKILSTFDYRYLIKDFFEEENLYEDFNETDLGETIFANILKEYTKLTSSLKEVKNYKHKILIKELEFKYDTTTSILNLYNSTSSLEVLWVLGDIGWKINRDIPYGPQIDRITKLCIGLKNKIKIQKINYTKKYEKKSEQNKKNISLSKQAVYLESNLELGYFLDVRKCSVEQWQNYQDLSREKEMYYEKQKLKNSRTR